MVLKQVLDRALAQGLLFATVLDRNKNNAFQIVAELAVSRAGELETNRIGLKNLTRANYTPADILGFMQKLQQRSDSTPNFVSTHPATSERINNLQQQINPQTANQGKGLNNRAYRERISSL